MPPAKRRKHAPSNVTWETVRQIALALPEVEEGKSYGTPAFRVQGKLFVRLHQCGDSVVVKITQDERAVQMQVNPNAFYITDHYTAYPWMLVGMAAVEREELRELLEEAWRLTAPKRLVTAYYGA